MSFNPPPHWPVPPGWSPPPDWNPPASWPQAPPGWLFWDDEPDVADDEPADAAGPEPPGETAIRNRAWRLPVIVMASISIVAVLTVGLVFMTANEPDVRIEMQPHTEVIAPTWVDPGWITPLYIDFSAWTRFGGIDATFSDNGESVRLDTHDTTATWRTNWSGLISPLTTTCAVRIVGRARDISHASGVPGGFGIGLGTLAPSNPDNATLSGTAMHYDFGQQGFRTASYPSDGDHGLTLAPLDHRWHDIEVIIDATSHTLNVDGQTVAKTPFGGRCGHPFIRVWAGSAEFAEFTATPWTLTTP
jgi:hypothetical protein